MLPSYPRSFGRLLAIGFALVALPPMVELASNAISITQLSDRSEHAVYQAARVTQASRQLSETVTALERNARQFLILPAPELLDAYTTNHQRLSAIASEFSGLDIDSGQRSALDGIVSGEAIVFAALSDRATRPADLRAAVQRFGQLSDLAQEITRAGDERIGREVEALRSSAAQARRILYWQLLALVPVVVFTAIGFAVLIGRPIRALDAAIQRLGSGQLTGPVMVEGPRDLKDLGQRLEWMRSELVNIEHEKNRFLREISHALKTPLAALREGSALLTEEALGELTLEQREIAEILRRNSIELQRLIEELLDYDAAQFKRTVLKFTTVELRSFVQHIVENHKFALQAKRLQLNVDVAGVRVRADAEKMTGILDNLLSNAIKYSPTGGRVMLAVSRRGDYVVIDVADQGPGVAVEDRHRIFDPFYRGQALPVGDIKGSGVGLSIVREYAIAHGGNVELVESVVGTHFQVTLAAEALT